MNRADSNPSAAGSRQAHCRTLRRPGPRQPDAARCVCRRRLLGALAASAAAGLMPAARAQGFPERPIRLVVPFPPGALTDTIGRAVAERLRTALGQPVLVENRPGAGTLVGAAQVAKAPADGHTLMVATSTTLGIAPALFPNPPIRISDLTGVAMIGNVTLILVTRADHPAQSLQQLVTQIRARPGQLNFASPGNGTVHHLLVEMLKAQEQLFAVHIPYNGSAQALADVATGCVDFMFIDAAIAMPQLRAGRIRALAVTGAKRSALLPQVPALTEVYPKLDLFAWQSIAAPAGTPAAVVAQLNAEINKALHTAEFREQMQQVGVETRPMSVDEFNGLIRRDASRWAELVKRSGARVD